MKKITILLLFMWTLWSQAQIKDYTFSQVVGTYSEINDGILLGDTASDDQNFVDSAYPLGGSAAGPNITASVGPGFPIGFNFVFNGIIYDRFGVCNDGWISLGSSSAAPDHVDMRVAGRWVPLASITGTQSSNLMATIAGLASSIKAQAGASLMYKLVGTSPNRTLVVQWKKYKRTTSGDGDSFDFQIRLNETTNAVQIVYGNFVSVASNNLGFQVGLRAAPTNVASNFVNRTDALGTAGWINSTAGTDVSNANKMGVSGTYIPPMGLTFTWTPPSCGAVKDLVVGNITTESAVLNWGSYIPTPTGYEYVVSASATLPTGSGTPTTAKTANISGLSPNTLYNVFMRTNCTSLYTSWKLIGTFKTKCADVAMLFEDFDSYNLLTSTMPDCWGKGVTSLASPSTVTISITDKSVVPASAPYRLMMTGNAAPANLGTTYAILPAMSNIPANTHRLKFKAYATTNQSGRTLTVGYYTNSDDVSTFQTLQTISLNEGAANALEYTITPGALSGIKNLGFKNEGYAIDQSSTTAFIDDVKWEPIPSCEDVTAVAVSKLTHVSAKISWEKGSRSAWQYVYASPSVTNPYSLTGIDVPGVEPLVQLEGLSPGTTYKVWVRSKCESTFGAWIGPIILETTCAPVAEFAQNFDLQPSGSVNPLPTCWRKVGNAGAVTISQSPGAPSSPNAFTLNGDTDQPTIVALPPLSTSQSGTHRLKVKVKGSKPDVILQVGYLMDITDAESFNVVSTITTGTAYTSETIGLGEDAKSPYLAFRNPAYPVTGQVFIDDVVWESIPTCDEVSGLSATAITSSSALMQWTPGASESQWQYALGTATDISPFVLSALNMPSAVYNDGMMEATITGLKASATNKIWIRSKCGAASFGSWVGPYSIVTPACAAGTTFTQNFDMTGQPTIPACWAKSGSTGTVGVGAPVGGGVAPAPSGPYVLSLATNATSGPAVVAMPPMSNTDAGTHRLTFKYRNSSGSNLLEVGYLSNVGDPTTFIPLVTLTCSTSFQDGIADLGIDPGSQILAFRNNGLATIEIDNVLWAPIPPCENVTNLVVDSVTDNSISFKWTKAESETAWQYAVGPMTAANPTGLTINAVTGTPIATAINLSASNPLLPSTSYKIWVRSKCSSSSLGTWIGPITAKTSCVPVANFIENFATNVIPDCWIKVKGTVGLDTSISEPNDSFKLNMVGTSVTDPSIMAMPPLSNASAGDHMLKFKFKGTLPGTKLEVGYISNILDPTSFFLIDTFESPSSEISKTFTVTLSASPISNILAFRNPGINGATVSIDNVSWALIPHVVPACATNVKATPNTNCGKYATLISWDSVSEADGYLIDVSTAPGGSYVFQNLNVGTALNYSFMGNNNTTYYYTVKPYNKVGSATGCTQLSFITNPVACYCISVPKEIDKEGITHVQLGASEFMTPKLTYSDFTAKTVNIGQGSNNNLKITFDTYIPYSTYVWIDFNNNYDFEESERVFTGASSPTYNSIVDASFNLPATAALGTHRMRIAALPSSAIDLGNPCYNGSYGVTFDFNVNVVAPIANDNPAEAVALTVGTDFEANALIGTNVNATGSVAEPTPTCGNFSGSDVWYKAVVPLSGELTFEVKSVSGGITNLAAATYKGTVGKLTLSNCKADNQPKIILSGWTPHEVVYLRVWENGGDAFGSFKVSAYDSKALDIDGFDSINFSYYPNPVKDILNLSFNREMSNVTVMNLLGQQVISESLNSNQGKVDMSYLSAGTYLVRVTVGDQLKTIKVVKE